MPEPPVNAVEALCEAVHQAAETWRVTVLHAERDRDRKQRTNTQTAQIAAAIIRRGATHCKHGHIYDAANTTIRKEGWRECRICNRTRLRTLRAKSIEEIGSREAP